MMEVRRLEITIDKESGEILYKSEEDMDFYLFSKGGYLFNNNKPSVRLFHIQEWKRLTDQERAKVTLLLPMIDAKNRVMRLDRPTKPMEAKYLATALSISLSRTYALLKRLEAVELLRKDGDAWYVNPFWMMAGTRLHRETYQVWRKEADRVLPAWAIQKYKESEPDE